MRDVPLTELLGRVRTRWQVRSVAMALAVAGAVFAAAIILTTISVAFIAAVIAAAVMFVRITRLSNVDAARLIEGRFRTLDNLVVTAAELDEKPGPIRADIRDEIVRQAAERIGTVDASRVVPLLQPIAVAAAVLIGCGVLATIGAGAIRSRIDTISPGQVATNAAPKLRVAVTPPSYTRRKIEVFEDPIQVSVIAGSRIQIDAAGSTLRNWIATESTALELRPIPGADSRFLSVIVVPDAAPMLRVVTPGRDTALAEARGQIPITVESRDDLGLSALALRFTKASGGGENVSFTEGEIPLRLDRNNDQQWRGQATLALESLNLADGDILVYRAVARDTNPAGAPVQSEQYLIEIGKNAAIVDAGFALPTEEKKYAISQQMVIYKTEQLITGLRKGSPTGESALEQSRMIAIEQRMVRAEIVFLGGGEVEDELEEAAKSDELTEGRLQNSGRAEMLRAINAMSRAEAQLNEGRAADALVFERQALASLERALDRRRYFLRTLPDRSRIDTTRRLTGERKEARSWSRDQSSVPVDSTLDASRRVMRELPGAAGNVRAIDAALAARVAAIDPSSKELQAAAVAIASASNSDARLDAVQQAMKAVTAHALRTFPSSAHVEFRRDALGGLLADELAPRPRR
ncbi:MAG TPA: hypothetical protein VM096_07165 [Vicinamibacterales bacterium]|nr:hypothetical protein [Vicinamibacterales bacterium]